MRVVIDMNLAPNWTGTLTPLGIDAVHWSAIGPATAEDRDIHAWALANGYDILTRDHDFAGLAVASDLPRPSVLLVKAARAGSPETHAFVAAALAEARELIERGALLMIDVDRRAVRSLPLPRIPRDDD